MKLASRLAVALCSLSISNGRIANANEEPAASGGQSVAQQALLILERYCYRCHGQNGADEGGIDFILDPQRLLEASKIKPGAASQSVLFVRMSSSTDDAMPPPEETVRPSRAEIEIVQTWIDAGAELPSRTTDSIKRPFVLTLDVLRSVQSHLDTIPFEDRVYQRYFTITHLHNLATTRDVDLRGHRAALSKLINSLSWKARIVLPKPIDPEQTVFAIDLRDIDWDSGGQWQRLLDTYPYGLSHHQYPDLPESRDLARRIYEQTGTELPWLRADWFIAFASRPPLYESLLNLPTTAGELERRLNVDVEANLLRRRAARAGFVRSGVSEHNRLVERHDSAYGAYWKSYDFRSDTGRGNLLLFPLGPQFAANSFSALAFQHDGGEIIFNLPNGLQAYLLVDGQDRRIASGPIDVVSDSRKTGGTTEVINGLSCMSCHNRGMRRDFEDDVRRSSMLQGAARDQLHALYVAPEQMASLLDEDEGRFLGALERAVGPFLREGADERQATALLPEPVTPIARWYRLQELGVEEVAAELGLADVATLKTLLSVHPDLQQLGLATLGSGGRIKRELWENLSEFGVSPFQEAARVLKTGTPKNVR